MLIDILKVVCPLVFQSSSSSPKSKLNETDLGILKIALMVAALDNGVLPSEYAAFRYLSQHGFGYTEAATDAALKAAMHSAGYINLVSASDDDEGTLATFIDEAKAVLPTGFEKLSIEDVRQAITMWVAMAMSDGEYSKREVEAIERLRVQLAVMKAQDIARREEFWRSQPKEVRCYIEDYPGSMVPLTSKDFIGKVTTILKEFGSTMKASAKLEELIAKGE